MHRLLLLGAAALALAQSPAAPSQASYGLGHAPAADEIRRWDISVRPDGKGLPPGRGSAAEGKEIYTNRCLKGHGATGQGRDSVVLVGGRGTLNMVKPVKTVESYWP